MMQRCDEAEDCTPPHVRKDWQQPQETMYNDDLGPLSRRWTPGWSMLIHHDGP